MKRYVWSLAMALCLPGAALVAQDEAPGNGHGNGNGNGHGNGRGGPPPAHGRDLVDARTRFVRPDPAIDEDAAGDIRMKEHRGRIAIHVHVKHLDQGAVYDVAIARGEESEALGSITIVRDDDGDDREPGPRCHMASLTGDQAVPPVETLAAGGAIVVLTGRDRTTLRYEIAVAGLSGPPVAAHIHLGPPGEAGPVVHPLDHVELRGRVELSEEDLANLDAGNF
ncbi:MAG: CHRD domain-containing protein, partial [Planctomycetota bacterium]|nr:CHRD domain-containing protein [Planctomycetota bacterium]